MNTPDSNQAATMLYAEIMATIKRYGAESDVSAYQAIGAIEMAKFSLIEMIEDSHRELLEGNE